MKDLPHHIKKLNRRVVRSERKIQTEDEKGHPNLPQPPRQQKKQFKAAVRKEKEHRSMHIPSEDQRNREMKKRVPIFDKFSERPRTAKPTRKKTPPL